MFDFSTSAGRHQKAWIRCPLDTTASRVTCSGNRNRCLVPLSAGRQKGKVRGVIALSERDRAGHVA